MTDEKTMKKQNTNYSNAIKNKEVILVIPNQKQQSSTTENDFKDTINLKSMAIVDNICKLVKE